MPFLMNCTNKGCGKDMEPTISLKDNEVYCSLCDKPISNVSPFTKTQMKALGQVKRPQKMPFAFKCESCKMELTPVLKTDGSMVCPDCKNVHKNMSKPFAKMLKDHLESKFQIISKDEE